MKTTTVPANMLALNRLSPAGIGPDRLLLATLTNRSSGFEKSGNGPSNLLFASDSSSSLARGDGPGHGPGELVAREVELSEAAHGPERALGDDPRHPVARQVEHLEHAEGRHVGERAGERVVGEAERAQAREHGEDADVRRVARQAEVLQLQALHRAVAVAGDAVPRRRVALARARGAPATQLARRRAVHAAQRVAERDQNVGLAAAVGDGGLGRRGRREDGRGDDDDNGEAGGAGRPRPRHGQFVVSRSELPVRRQWPRAAMHASVVVGGRREATHPACAWVRKWKGGRGWRGGNAARGAKNSREKKTRHSSASPNCGVCCCRFCLSFVVGWERRFWDQLQL
jgi:hypothetical protein